MKISKLFLTLATVSSGLLTAAQSQAASLLTVADTTAIGLGWTDMKDTVLALISSSWAPMLGISAIIIGPHIVKMMFKIATK
ncbi:MAG: hypothetical protein HOO97_06255 [Sideroxydans sp.]|nr:hypothetical protein [Sideroxydans sp.]